MENARRHYGLPLSERLPFLASPGITGPSALPTRLSHHSPEKLQRAGKGASMHGSHCSEPGARPPLLLPPWTRVLLGKMLTLLLAVRGQCLDQLPPSAASFVIPLGLGTCSGCAPSGL